MTEIIFEVTEDEVDGGYTAKTLSSILKSVAWHH